MKTGGDDPCSVDVNFPRVVPVSAMQSIAFSRTADGGHPMWRKVFRWHPEEHAGVGLRGITAVPTPDEKHQVILGSREQEGRILRIDPVNDDTVELEIDSPG
ncbi:MAG: hypothetical protein AAFN70_08905 [Planctomycetota bacterium]